MQFIGKTKCKLDEYFSWYTSNGIKWAESVIDEANKYNTSQEDDEFIKSFKEYYAYQPIGSYYLKVRQKAKDDKGTLSSFYLFEYASKKLEDLLQETKSYYALLQEEPIFSICECEINMDGMCTIKMQNMPSFIVPNQFLYDTVIFEDLSNLNAETLNRMINCENAVMPTNGLSVSKEDVTEELSSISSKKEDLSQLEKQIYRSETDGLVELNNELEKLKEKIRIEQNRQLEEIQKKLSELEELKSRMETQLFLLDTQIYGIQCFMGDTVDFIKIRSGKNANTETPVTIYQKLRFMDEELGLLASLYNVDFSAAKIFERILQCNDNALELFLPNEKCVTFMRATRNAFYKEIDAYDGVIYEYEKFHGRRIAILIRNGENVYIGWTDETRISIQENAFYNPNQAQTSSLAENEGIIKSDDKNTIASRYFIYSIMQGILKEQKMLSFPEQVNILDSKYVILSFATGWISDNRFGSFANMQNRVNTRTIKGDNVILLQKLYDSKHWNTYTKSYDDCDRSHGLMNRTNDCSLESNKIYKINLVESKMPEYDGPYIRATKNIWKGTMKWGYDEHEVGANFRIYNNEFLNLTYMNSVWIEYIIINRNIGNVGEKVDYAYLIHALKIAKEYLLAREEKELKLISKEYAGIADVNEWQVALSEWKLKNSIRELNEFQAKRFAKSVVAEDSESNKNKEKDEKTYE